MVLRYLSKLKKYIMSNLEDKSNKLVPGTEDYDRERAYLAEHLSYLLLRFSLKSVILDLAAMSAELHQEYPYSNWDKDERLLLFLSHYVEN